VRKKSGRWKEEGRRGDLVANLIISSKVLFREVFDETSDALVLLEHGHILVGLREALRQMATRIRQILINVRERTKQENIA